MKASKKVAGVEPDVLGPEDIDWSKAKVLGRGLKVGRRVDLRTLRTALGKTQVDIAHAAKMSQGDVSRLESREDLRMSTLARYVEALGGKLDVAVRIGDRTYMLAV